VTRYLLTGGAGFIGSHLTERLLQPAGAEVIVLDDLSTGAERNLAAVAGHPGLSLVKGSVLDAAVVDELVGGCDAVVHLAAAVGVARVVQRPLDSLLVNGRGTELVLDAADRHHRRILLASSSEVYGKNPRVPLREDDDRLLGSTGVRRWFYSAAKAHSEMLALALAAERDLPVTVVRLFNTVGPRQARGGPGMVIPSMVRAALAGGPIRVYGTGVQTRSFCHVADSVAAIAALLEHPGALGEVFNVGSSEEVSMLRLAELVRQAANPTAAIELIPYEEVFGTGFEDVPRRVPDTAKLRAAVGWAPAATLRDVLAQTVAELRADEPCR
jgi:UDP-glucose 4-epimerase